MDHAQVSCVVCVTWLGSLWAHFPEGVTTATGILAGIYYGVLIIKEIRGWLSDRD
jgi:hypothetical protein